MLPEEAGGSRPYGASPMTTMTLSLRAVEHWQGQQAGWEGITKASDRPLHGHPSSRLESQGLRGLLGALEQEHVTCRLLPPPQVCSLGLVTEEVLNGSAELTKKKMSP